MTMLRTIGLLMLPLALGAAAPAPGALEQQVEVTLRKAYGPYQTRQGGGRDWLRPVFTTSTRQLIRAWQKHVGSEPYGINDHGWFCDCQDWDERAFGWKRLAIKQLAPGRVEVRVRLTIVRGTTSEQRLVLVREGTTWAVEDMFTQTVPKGIRAAMREELRGPPGE